MKQKKLEREQGRRRKRNEKLFKKNFEKLTLRNVNNLKKNNP